MPKQTEKLAAKIARFMRQYQRKASSSLDRGYNRELEGKIKRMDPAQLDELLNGGEENSESGENKGR